jgi:hypothetical protein
MDQSVKDYHGSLVALEGSPDIVSTQLRLLPNSPNIMVLPTLQQYLKNDDEEDGTFKPRSFIRRVHEASLARKEAALEFLRRPRSGTQGERLVFLNGGTAGAQALLVAAISQHITNGDWVKGEAEFVRLVQEGVAGLEKEERLDPAAEDAPPAEPEEEEEEEEEEQDPSTRAMRAAEALDHETEDLQPSNILDLTIKTRPRSCSLPVYGYSDSYNDAAPFLVFGARGEGRIDEAVDFGSDGDSDDPNEEDEEQEPLEDSERTPLRNVKHRLQTPLSPTFPMRIFGRSTDIPIPPRSPSCVGEVYGPKSANDAALLSPISDAFYGPGTPDRVVFGEARVVSLSSSSPSKPLKRTRSLDRIFAGRSRAGDLISSPTVAIPAEEEPATPDEPNRRHSSFIVSRIPVRNSLDVPRPIFGRATLVRRGPLALKIKVPSKLPQYVDSGTDAIDWDEVEAKPQERPPTPEFEPVLPLVEDLVIQIVGDTTNRVLESVVTGFKNGRFPVGSAPKKEEAAIHCETEPRASVDTIDESPEFPATPKSHSFAEIDSRRPSHGAMPTSDSDEYDPFASDGKYAYNPAPCPSKSEIRLVMPTINTPQPPTPAQTPPPTAVDSTNGHKFRTFSVAGRRTAVYFQNGLRSVLNGCFPPSSPEDHQCHFPLLPEVNGLWNPIFGEADPDTSSLRPDGRKTDLILAIGSQRGVDKDFLSAITAEVDKLGAKPNGVTRSGRLDMRRVPTNYAFLRRAVSG